MLHKGKKFKSKNIFFITSIYFLILFFIISSNQLQINEFVYSSMDNDNVTFFEQAQDLGFNTFTLSKYFFNSLLINSSEVINRIVGLNSMHLYGIFKGFIQYLSVLYFSESIIKIFGKRIAFLTFLIFLFDPYLYSLKLSLLRDDLICSFALVTIGASLKIYTKEIKNFFSIRFSPFWIGIIGLFGSKPILAPLIIGVLIFLSQINIKNIKKLRNFRIKIIWIISPIFIVFLFFSLGGYTAQIYSYFTPSILNILLTLKNHILSPLPGNELIRNGLLITDASSVYWWFEIRFVINTIFIFITVASVFLKPLITIRSLSILTFTGILISLAYSQVQDLDIIWGLTAGPRQGYLSYLLLVPGSLSLLSKAIYRDNKKLKF